MGEDRLGHNLSALAMHMRGVTLPGGRERDLFVSDGGTLTFNPIEGARTVADGVFLLPGLTDMHSHLQLESPEPDAPPAERARASARMELEAGVLALREPGCPTRASHGLGPHEDLPRTFTAGRFLHPPGGYIPGLGRPVEPDELVAAALDELAHSDGWVKLVADFPDGSGLKLNFTGEQLTSVAEAIHAAGGRLAIHATQEAGIELAIDAEFDTIEHGQGMNERLIAKMAAAGTTWVPTMVILPLILPFFADVVTDPGARTALARAIDEHPKWVRLAAEAGVRLLAGTDAGMVPHGLIAREIRMLIDSGLEPETAIGAGSWEGRRFLGLPGLEEGAPADVTSYDRDPREDPAILEHPTLIILAGRQVSTDRK